MENVIDGSMAMMTALTPSAAKAMGGEMIHCSTTVVACVRSTEGDPSLRPTATLMVLLSILRPREEIGRAFSQAPDSLVEAAKRRAIEVALEALSINNNDNNNNNNKIIIMMMIISYNDNMEPEA